MLEQQMFAFALLGSEWVMWLLVILSIVCVAVAIERSIYLALNKTPTDKLQAALHTFFQDSELSTLRSSLSELKGIEARVLRAGIESAEESGKHAAEDTIAGHLIFEKAKLERGLIIIGTTGSNAPFLGLFGTVLGIIKAFHDLSLATDEAASSVMAGISEALVATAIGLLVAIPAVVLYNYFKQVNKNRTSTLVVPALRLGQNHANYLHKEPVPLQRSKPL